MSPLVLKLNPANRLELATTTVPELAVAITVGNSDVRYPHLQEYGTTHHAAQPYFWPAVRLHRKRAQNAIKSAVGRAVKKHWGKA